MAVNVEGFDAVVDEVFFEGDIEGGRAADVVDRVVMVDAHLGGKEFPVEVGGAKKVVVSEENGVGRVSARRRRMKDSRSSRGRAGLDTVGSVLKAERRVGIQPGHFLVHRCGHHLVAGRALLGGDETLLAAPQKGQGSG